VFFILFCNNNTINTRDSTSPAFDKSSPSLAAHKSKYSKLQVRVQEEHLLESRPSPAKPDSSPDFDYSLAGLVVALIRGVNSRFFPKLGPVLSKPGKYRFPDKPQLKFTLRCRYLVINNSNFFL